MKRPPVLKLLETPLSGVRLIEASAGTGKTYTIAGLFVRLVVEQGLTVDRILVVTYTRAATEELKTRIRSRLAEARDAFSAGGSTDAFLGPLVERSADQPNALRNLDRAVRDFDRACIFTIHGFCQRVLSEYAFETGAAFDFELAPDPLNLRREVAEDFWRRQFYNAPPELIAYAVGRGRVTGPGHYLNLIDRPTLADLAVLPQTGAVKLQSLESYRSTYRRLATAWAAMRGPVIESLGDPALNGRLYGKVPGKRERTLATLAESMDRFTEPGHPGFPPFEQIIRFTTEGLESATRKGGRTPRHGFFDLCQELKQAADRLSAEMDGYLQHLDIRFFRFAETELLRRKQVENVLFYDDLLLAVRNALRTANGPLKHAVRKRFRAALVDEFQDTDSIQCDIFMRLFSESEGLLFMIGDPKQSIYSFRGSDIFSYLKAARRAQQTYTLLVNWRSEPDLIQAVNTLFTNAPRPFVYRAIGFEPGSSAAVPPPSPAAQNFDPAMHLWYFPGEGERPVSKTDAVPRIAAAVADEILHLVSRPADAVHAGEIAVLVRSNYQGRRMKEALDARSVPAVLHGAGNVFDTPEAAELQRVLTGICEHNREDRFRSALVTDLLGVTASQLEAADADASAWEMRRRRFRQYADTWQRNGFMPMFRWLLAREQILERLLGFVDGERRLTNLFHLAEQLQAESLHRPPSMLALIRWLADQRASRIPRQEDQLLRLESDARAVNILTIHRSKGLEFPIVFCPFTWDGSRLTAADGVRYHDTEKERTVLDLGSDRIEEHRRQAETEQLAENLRLLYVAITRAQRRCYLVWGRFNRAETSAPAYLFHHPGASADDADIVAALHSHVSGLDDSARLADLENLVARSSGAIELTVAPHRHHREPIVTARAAGTLSCRPFTGRIDRSWKITSYTALVSQRSEEPELPDYDRTTAIASVLEIPPADAGESTSVGQDVDHFPRGARAGIFFHDLLQQIPFRRPLPEALIAAKLQEYNFAGDWQPVVARALARVLQAELIPGLRLDAVTRRRRIHELQFYLPVRSLTPRDLQSIFKDVSIDIPKAYSIQMESLDFAPLRGFLKGYVDLVFEHDGRYYLLDWKSNYLGIGPQPYQPVFLEKVMRSERYVLQYLLYTVAVDRYLQNRIPDYRYRTHFGGVFYLFLRGLANDPDGRAGIFYDLPDPAAVEALGRALIAPQSGGSEAENEA